MDQSISAIIGAIIFISFVAGLANSIGSIPFFLIVGSVILMLGVDTVQLIRGQIKSGKPKPSSK